MIKIAVLDSVVDITYPMFNDKAISNCLQFSKLCNTQKKAAIQHGTAVCEIIFKFSRDIEIVCFPIFDSLGETDPENVLSVLEYIKNDGSYHIVNMSMGFTDSLYEKKIKSICDQLHSTGVTLVASFDNGGEMTYPACLDSVIGVDIFDQMDIKDSFWFNENGCVNVIFPDKQYAVANAETAIQLVRGTSFAAAEVTGNIAFYLVNQLTLDSHNISAYLSRRASKVVTPLYEESCIKPECDLGRVALFPYCKETVAIAHSRKYLTCNFIGLYDYKFSNHIGETLKLSGEDKQITIQSEQNIPWQDIDTLVVGYTAENISTVKTLFYNVLEIAVTKNIQVYSLGEVSIEHAKGQIWYPKIDFSFLPKTQQGKLWAVDKPVIALLGTRSRQGKFTTQIKLVHAFQNFSYDIGWVSTEPSGYLFGADYVFPYGYNSTVHLNTEEYTLAINKILHSLSEGNDALVLSLQSSVIHMNMGNLNQLTIKQHALLFGASVDIVVLCVNIDDDDELIASIIKYLDACFHILVIGILIYPFSYTDVVGGNLKETAVSPKQLQNKEKHLTEIFKRPTFEMNDQNILKITQLIIDELSDEE